MQGTQKPEAARAQDPIPLPLPVDDRNPSIFKAIEHSGALRTPRVTPLPPQQLSNILWSTWGANRRDGRNAAREIELFLLSDRSAFHYNARRNHLQPLPATPDGDSAAAANAAADPLQIVYVATLREAGAGAQQAGRDLPQPQLRDGYYCADTGALAGKVYLFASAHGISAVPQSCDRAALALRLGLSASQHVLFAQSMCYPRATSSAGGRTA